MPKPNKTQQGVDYLREFPEFRVWIHQCALCGMYGHDPDLPEVHVKTGYGMEWTTQAFDYLRSYFPSEMTLDDEGRCEQCARVAGG